jgi:hypothetical protein
MFTPSPLYCVIFNINFLKRKKKFIMGNMLKGFAETGDVVNTQVVADFLNKNPNQCVGKIILRDFKKQDFEKIRIIPENSTTLITPDANKEYIGDGFYCSIFSNSKYWYKVSNGATVEVIPHVVSGVEIIATNAITHCKSIAELLGKEFINGWEPKSKPHNTLNPFDL